MVIAAICDVVPFCQLLFRVPQPCAMYYNNYSFQVISYRPEGKCVFICMKLYDQMLHSYTYSAFFVPISSTLSPHYRGILWAI